MKVRPLHPHAALLLEGGGAAGEGRNDEENIINNSSGRYVAVSDLHIGLGSELVAKGITIRTSLVQEMLAEIDGLVDSHGADGVILLGDIKNTVGAISRQEWGDIPAFLKGLSARTEVYLVPGNHDSNIRHLVPGSIHVVSSKGMALEDTLLVHGHSMPSDVRSGVGRVVMGHIHPVFLKEGSVVNGERVWIYMQVKRSALFASAAGEERAVEVVVVPSINRYLYASGERYLRHRKKSVSPIIGRILEAQQQKRDAIQKCVIATLDGSVIGSDASALQHVL